MLKSGQKPDFLFKIVIELFIIKFNKFWLVQ